MSKPIELIGYVLPGTKDFIKINLATVESNYYYYYNRECQKQKQDIKGIIIKYLKK